MILDGVKIIPSLKYETLNSKKSGTTLYGTHWSDKFHYVSQIAATGNRYEVIVYLHGDQTIDYIEINYDPNPWGVPNVTTEPSEPTKKEDEDSELWEYYRQK